jgi:hypothetical protein
MPDLVTAAQLRAVLGVPNTLYDDTALDAIINTAEDAIGDFLIQWKVGIDKHYSETTTETTIHTTRPHKFYETQTVAISGVEAHVNGNKTISSIVDDYTFKITTTGAPVHQDYYYVIPNGIAAENDISQYDGIAAVEESCATNCYRRIPIKTSCRWHTTSPRFYSSPISYGSYPFVQSYRFNK